MSGPPVRLLEASHVPEAERALLEAGRSEAPVGYDVEAGAARFRASLARLAATAAVATAAGSAAKSASGKALFAKVLAKVLMSVAVGSTFVAVGMVAGAMMARHAARERPVISLAPSARPPQVTAQARTATAEIPALSAEPQSFPEPQPGARLPGVAPAAAPVPAVTHDRPRAHREVHSSAATSEPAAMAAAPDTVPASAPAAVADAPAPESVAPAPSATALQRAATPAPPPEAPGPLGELQGIALARSLVARDPGAALGVLDRLRKDHPNGYFVEEREALTVLALASDGQRALAKEHAATFLRAFPNGTFTEQIREVLAR